MIARVADELIDEIERRAARDLDLRLLASITARDLLVHAARHVDGDRRGEAVRGSTGLARASSSSS